MFLKGNLVNLRAMEEKDLKYVAEFLNDPEIILNLEDDIPLPTNEDRQKEWYRESIKEEGLRHGYYFSIDAKDGRIIGSCGINRVHFKNRVALVGIFIGDRDYLGKGYGTEAMMLLLDFIFREININKVSLRVFSFNKRAVRSYEKCGFKIETINREGIFRDGKYHDEYTMSILKDEYFQRQRIDSNE